jgi:hypothetical protein
MTDRPGTTRRSKFIQRVVCLSLGVPASDLHRIWADCPGYVARLVEEPQREKTDVDPVAVATAAGSISEADRSVRSSGMENAVSVRVGWRRPVTFYLDADTSLLCVCDGLPAQQLAFASLASHPEGTRDTTAQLLLTSPARSMTGTQSSAGGLGASFTLSATMRTEISTSLAATSRVRGVVFWDPASPMVSTMAAAPTQSSGSSTADFRQTTDAPLCFADLASLIGTSLLHARVPEATASWPHAIVADLSPVPKQALTLATEAVKNVSRTAQSISNELESKPMLAGLANSEIGAPAHGIRCIQREKSLRIGFIVARNS